MAEYTNKHYKIMEDGSVYCLYCYKHFKPEEFQEHQDKCFENGERVRTCEELARNIFR